MLRNPDRAQCFLRASLLAVLLALGACGPGTGGTGTGPIALNYSGAASGGVFAPAPGACELATCERVGLHLEEARVELATGCARFVHIGTWAVDAGGMLVLAGDLETRTPAGTTQTPSTLRLHFSSPDLATASVTVLLLRADGGALLGPLTLGPGGPPPADQACAPG